MIAEHVLDPYRRFTRPLYAGRDAAHDFRHIERMLSRLGELSEGMEPAPREDLVAFLACFHGLGPRLEDEERLVGETRAFLTGRGWTGEEIDAGFEALERHVHAPEGVEEAIVHDANALETIGALGVAKAFTTGGARGQPYAETARIFERRMAQVKMRTPRGRERAEEGRDYAREFLRRLEEEW